jgi:hypothetical protein
MRYTESAVAGDRTRKHLARVALAAAALAGLLALAGPAAAQSSKDHDNGGGDPWPDIPRLVGRVLLCQDPVGRVIVWVVDAALQGDRR